MHGIFGERGSKQTMTVSAQAILAYLQLAPWNNDDWKEVYTASVRHQRVQRMPLALNGREFSCWLDSHGHDRQHVKILKSFQIKRSV